MDKLSIIIHFSSLVIYQQVELHLLLLHQFFQPVALEHLGTSWNRDQIQRFLKKDRPWRWLLRVFAHAEAGGYGKYMETRLKHVCFTFFYVFFNEHVRFLLLNHL